MARIAAVIVNVREHMLMKVRMSESFSILDVGKCKHGLTFSVHYSIQDDPLHA